MRWLFVCSVALALSACNCDSDRVVPFGLDASLQEQGSTEQLQSEIRQLGSPSRELNIDGVELNSLRPLRAIWLVDIDGDGDRDAIGLHAAEENAAVELSLHERAERRFLTPRSLMTPHALNDGCSVRDARFAEATPYTLAAVEVDCEGDRQQLRWALQEDGESVNVLAALSWPSRLRIRVETPDVDEDGKADIRLQASLAEDGLEVPVVLIRRANRLRVGRRQPERALRAHSRQALRQLQSEVEQARSLSKEVLNLHALLCREGGRAEFEINGAQGVECGQSDGAGRAATTVLRASASLSLPRLLAAMAAMESPGYLINEERRQYAGRAIETNGSRLDWGLRQIGVHHAARFPPARLSSLAFIDEHRLLLRGAEGRILTLGGADERVAAADARIVDPSGRLAVHRVTIDCNSTSSLEIVPLSRLIEPVAEAAVHSRILLTPEPTVAEVCTGAGNTDRSWEVLGWAPQGIVTRHGGDLRLSPMDATGRALSPTRALRVGAPLPAPLPPGAVTTDGRFRVTVEGRAILLHPPRGAAPKLVWPEGFAMREGSLHDAAVSPTGRRIAVMEDDRILLLAAAENLPAQ